MRRFYITLLFMLTLACVSAQDKTEIDTSLKFNMRYTKCERKWVVLPLRDTDKYYSFGFIYIDAQAGFTYDVKGTFKVDKNNTYHPDTSVSSNTSIKVRLTPNYRLMAVLPPARLKQMNLPLEPWWVKHYYTFTDTVERYYRLGYLYNDLDESGLGLPYLEKAHQINPSQPDVQFELAYAYNALGKFDQTIAVLEPAMAQTTGNPLFYKELGFAYMYKKDYEKAIMAYKKGLEHFPDKLSETRGELAFNMASAYKNLGNINEYKNWMIKAKSFTPTTSRYYKTITDAGF